MADAAYAIFLPDVKAFTGNFLLDDDVLREAGVIDFAPYRDDPDSELEIDIFVAPGGQAVP
ncbi:hypothetical protein [Sphingobium sp.]|uniref:hypothetical protein n=1 Tax=Sphingobium sp. TaxID=1912891 RepID=UPI0028BE816D|nr:hypothetical protein [Sphingobium sp.]